MIGRTSLFAALKHSPIHLAINAHTLLLFLFSDVGGDRQNRNSPTFVIALHSLWETPLDRSLDRCLYYFIVEDYLAQEVTPIGRFCNISCDDSKLDSGGKPSCL